MGSERAEVFIDGLARVNRDIRAVMSLLMSVSEALDHATASDMVTDAERAYLGGACSLTTTAIAALGPVDYFVAFGTPGSVEDADAAAAESEAADAAIAAVHAEAAKG